MDKKYHCADCDTGPLVDWVGHVYHSDERKGTEGTHTKVKCNGIACRGLNHQCKFCTM